MSNWKQNAVSDRTLDKNTAKTPMSWSNRQNTVMTESWGGEEKQRVRLIYRGRKRPKLDICTLTKISVVNLFIERDLEPPCCKIYVEILT